MRACFLFWNIQKKDLRQRIARIVRHHSVDAVILAESRLTDGTGPFSRHRSEGAKVRFYSRWAPQLVSEAFNDPIGSLVIWRVLIGPPPGVLLSTVHFPSKMGSSEDSQALQAVRLADDIRRAEEREGHQRTILVGDMNMNPFDSGMVGAQALNAVMTSNLAVAAGRRLQGRDYPFFYNPMWGCFGDRTPGPAGTHFSRRGEGVAYYWNMLDQVVVRSSLAGTLEAVTILDTDGSHSLVNKKGIPDGHFASDHLPLLFVLDL